MSGIRLSEKQALEIIKEGEFGHLSLVYENRPYTVFMNHALVQNYLYFHTGIKGKKLDIIKLNHNACYSVCLPGKVIPHENPCKFGFEYRSAIASGIIELVSDEAQKIEALNHLTERFKKGFYYQPHTKDNAGRVNILRMKIEQITGKKSND
ncbi:MAG: pyridoxamine 5'-phosphate oxidase family protein [Acidobacteria bacterium]|nr:pyridoxamine 5'-phosphate oxidase family protein [Acidobacteriota bacterium]